MLTCRPYRLVCRTPPPQKGRSSAATSGVATAVASFTALLALAGVILYFAL